MQPMSTFRRVIANSDRVNELASGVARLKEAADNLATDINGRLDRIRETADNQSGDANRRLDQLFETASSLRQSMDRLHEALDNQSEASNRRMDQLIEVATNGNQRLDRLHEAADNQSNDSNYRLDRLIEVVADFSDNANLRLSKLVAAITNTPLEEAPPAPRSPRRIEVRRADVVASAAWLNAESPGPLPLPRWLGERSPSGRPNPSRLTVAPNSMRDYQPLLDAIEPWRGPVPKGYLADFLGILTDANFLAQFGREPALTGG